MRAGREFTLVQRHDLSTRDVIDDDLDVSPSRQLEGDLRHGIEGVRHVLMERGACDRSVGNAYRADVVERDVVNPGRSLLGRVRLDEEQIRRHRVGTSRSFGHERVARPCAQRHRVIEDDRFGRPQLPSPRVLE